MAHCRYAVLTRSLFTSNLKHNQKQPCLRRSQSDPSGTKLTSPLEVYQNLFTKIGLVSCIQDNISKSSMYNWKDTVMIITGGSKGIGAHIIRFGLEEGVKKVMNLDTDEKNGLALQYELNHRYGKKDKVKFVNCDVTVEEHLIEEYQSILCDKDKTFILINNGDLLNDDLSDEQLDEEIDTAKNVLVTSNLTALELMRTDNNGKGGTIINIAPAAVLCTTPSTPENVATKHAIITLSIGLGNDEFFRKTGVRVLTVCCGARDAGYNIVSERESGPTRKLSTSMQPICHQCPRTAAQAIMEIYKHGSSGSIWVTKEGKPNEDITSIIKKSYRVYGIKDLNTPCEDHIKY